MRDDEEIGVRIDIELPRWLTRPTVRRAAMHKLGKGHRRFEGTGSWGRIYKFGPFWITWIKEVVIENEIVGRYKKIRAARERRLAEMMRKSA